MSPPIRTSSAWVGIASSLLLVANVSAQAADLSGPPLVDQAAAAQSRSGWTFNFTPYGWLTWVKGDTAVKGRQFDVDAGPGTIISALDWSGIPAWMSYAEARNGKLSLFNDIVYAKLGATSGFARSAQGRIATATLSGSVRATYTQAIVELGAAYEIWASGTAGTPGVTAFDLLAGARYWYQQLDVSGDLAATISAGGSTAGLAVSGGRVFAKSGPVDWIDPMIGARIRHQFGPGTQITVRGDVGGFGVGSDFSWQALATFDWRLSSAKTHVVDAYLGYRALSVDYTKGTGNNKYEFDAVQHGPVMGLSVKF